MRRATVKARCRGSDVPRGPVTTHPSDGRPKPARTSEGQLRGERSPWPCHAFQTQQLPNPFALKVIPPSCCGRRDRTAFELTFRSAGEPINTGAFGSDVGAVG